MHRRRQPCILLRFFIFFLVIIIFTIFYIDREIRPIAVEYCINEIEFFALDSMNTAVSNDMNDNQDLYKNITNISNSHGITTVETDTYKINKIKTNIMQKSDIIFNSIVCDKVFVPIGSIYNNIFLFGHGFDIPIQMIPMSTVNVDFASTFESIGINQSIHKIIMICSTEIKIIMPYSTSDFTVEHKIAISETLLLGEVPDSYTLIEDLSSEILEKYSHYAN